MSEESKTHEMSKQSSEVNKVTAVEKSEKTKDPRKVELGKKLAKISKEAKERKAKQREVIECKRDHVSEISVAEEINDYLDFRYIVGGVTIVAALGGLYYAYKNDVRLAIHNRVSEQSEKVKTINKNDSEPKYEITKCKPSHLAMDTLSCIENL